MTQLEKEIEAKLVETIKRRGGMCLKLVCPGWAGVPDRICLLPRGRVVFAELKRPKMGQISARQEWWRKKLQSLGFSHYYIYNATDVVCLELLLIAEDAEAGR